MSAATGATRLTEIVRKHEADILAEWVREQRAATTRRDDLIREAEVREQSREFLSLFTQALAQGGDDVNGPAWEQAQDMLRSLSESRTQQGFTPSEVATFVFSLKQPLFTRLRTEFGIDAAGTGPQPGVPQRHGRRRSTTDSGVRLPVASG